MIDEKLYEAGSKAAWQQIFQIAGRELRVSSDIKEFPKNNERLATIATLRRLCEDYGDNDWSDDLHLSDIIEKHLVCHLIK